MKLKFFTLLACLIATMFLMSCNSGEVQNGGFGSSDSDVRLVKRIEANYERYNGYKWVRDFSYDSNNRVTKVVYTNYYNNTPYAQITTELLYPTSSYIYMKSSFISYEEGYREELPLAIELNKNGYAQQLTWSDGDGRPYTVDYDYDSSGCLRAADSMIPFTDNYDLLFEYESVELSWRNGNVVSVEYSWEDEEVITTTMTYTSNPMSNVNLDLNYFVIDEDSLVSELTIWGPHWSNTLPACGYLGKVNAHFIESMYDRGEDKYEYSWEFDSKGCPISCVEKINNYRNEFEFTYYN